MARVWLRAPGMDVLARELRAALRLLVRSPAFVASVVLPLALALGANTALFSVIRGVLLRPLAYPQTERLVRVYRRLPTGGEGGGPLSPLNYTADIASTPALSARAAWTTGSGALSGEGPAEHLRLGFGTASLLPVLGVNPALGRWFSSEEEQPGRDRSIVLSHALWSRRFGADPAALGRTVQIDGDPYQVVGVLPAGVELPELCDAWVPISFTPAQLEPPARNRHWLQVAARLAPGSTLEAARRELAEAGRRTLADHPEAYSAPFVFAPVPMQDDLVRSVRPTLLLLFAAVALVLLMACLNVGNLLLARATARERELAIRSALGAGRRALVRQLVVEALLMSAAAGALGLLLAEGGTGALLSLAPEALPRASSIRLDGWVLAFTAAASLASGIVFGLVPALTASDLDVDRTLRAAGSMRPRTRLLRRILVMVDVGLALVILCAASLLLRSFVHALGVDPGFRPENVVTFSTAVSGPSTDGARGDDPVRRYPERALEVLRALPGTQAAGAISMLPMSMSASDRLFELEGDRGGPGAESRAEEIRMVTPGFFETLRIPLREGRSIAATDTASSPAVVVVNEAFARKLFPGGSALGRRLRLTSPQTPWTTVVGVVADVREFGLDQPVQPVMYFPHAQLPTGTMSFVVRSASRSMEVGRAAAAEVAAIDPRVPAFGLRSYESMLSASVAARRFTLALVGTFAALALLLAAVGLYGVVAYSVRQRTREIGVRMAVGADPGRIARLVAGESARMLAIGLGAGLVGSLGAARLLSGFLYGVGPADPLAVVAAAGVLALAAALATLLPVRRATRVDPVVALGSE